MTRVEVYNSFIKYQRYIPADSAIINYDYHYTSYVYSYKIIKVTEKATGWIYNYKLRGVDSTEIWIRYNRKDYYIFGDSWTEKYSKEKEYQLKQRKDVWFYYCSIDSSVQVQKTVLCDSLVSKYYRQIK